MLFDFNEAWPRVAEAQYDVCVCGTGPAGITIARKLAAHGKKVLLLEAGGLSYSDESQDHYRGKNVGRTYWPESEPPQVPRWFIKSLGGIMRTTRSYYL